MKRGEKEEMKSLGRGKKEIKEKEMENVRIWKILKRGEKRRKAKRAEKRRKEN